MSAHAAQLQRATFRTSRMLDFFSQKELTAQAGHQVSEWPLVILKELLDNACDACEEADIAPVITVTVDEHGIAVADNGPGLPAKTIEGVLDYTVRASSREAYVSPTRGAQGNALKTLIGMSFALDPGIGDVAVIEANGARHTINVTIDAIRQEPVISRRTAPSNVQNGTRILVRWPDLACSILEDAKARFVQIADDFTWLNPHLTLTVDWFEERHTVEATSPSWKKWKPSDPTPPHWYKTEHLARLISAYLAHDQDNGRQRTVREFVSEFRGLSRSAKQQSVLRMAKLSHAPLSQFARTDGMDMSAVHDLLRGMRWCSRPVKPADLGVIGEAHFRKRFEEAGCEMESFQYRKVLDDGDGLPTVIEVAFGWCEEEDASLERRLVTGVNWSAGIINPFRQLGTYESLDSVLAEQKVKSYYPVIVVIHVAHPRVQYTDRGKSAVAGIKTDKIKSAVELVTAKWAKQIKAEERHASARSRRSEAMSKRRKKSAKDAAWEVMDEAYRKVSNNDRLPANARQLMYAVRPHVQEVTGKTLGDNYFTQTLLPDYIEQNPHAQAWTVAYDDRGHFTEPHTGHKVGLGTLDVRRYLSEVRNFRVAESIGTPSINVCTYRYPTFGPKNRYGNILFIEKEGFNPLIKAVHLEDRYDLGIASTKGMSVTACRELFDTLCFDHAIRVFVLHDFDKSGFSIVGTLMQATKRYTFKNDIEIIDLGLRIGDIEGLQRESSNLSDKEETRDKARANLEKNGATPEEIEFLLDQRVELNAFTSDALVAFIEDKLKMHGVKKVVPDEKVLASAYRRFAIQRALQKNIDEVLRSWQPPDIEIPADLYDSVVKELAKNPMLPWDRVIASMTDHLSNPA